MLVPYVLLARVMPTVPVANDVCRPLHRPGQGYTAATRVKYTKRSLFRQPMSQSGVDAIAVATDGASSFHGTVNIVWILRGPGLRASFKALLSYKGAAR